MIRANANGESEKEKENNKNKKKGKDNKKGGISGKQEMNSFVFVFWFFISNKNRYTQFADDRTQRDSESESFVFILCL